ncbi:MAG: esterase [Myxococcota bacterium]|jgi:esterase
MIALALALALPAHGMDTLVVEAADPHLGTAIVLHGNDLCGPFYAPLADRLAGAGFDVVLVTMSGYGGEPPLEPVTLDGMLAEVGDLVRAQTAPVTLIGHSLGGLVAFATAAREPEAVLRLVLMEAPIVPWKWLAQRAADRYDRQVVDGDRSQFENRGPGYTRLHSPDAFPEEAMQTALRCRRLSDPNTPKQLIATGAAMYPLPYDAVTQPVLLVRGASSGFMLRASQWDLQWRLPNATSVVIDEAGHWMANENDPALASAIVEFAGP